MKALIIVDVQNDFLPGGALGVPHGDEILPVINSIQSFFPLIVATQDWHPKSHGSFASSYEGKQVFETTFLDSLEQILWPDHCVQGSLGARFSANLNMNKVEAIFRKGTDATIDSYSGFFDNGKKKATGLSHYLKGRGVKEVFLAGLAADFCVGFTALDALSEGFITSIIEDGTRAIEESSFITMKDNIESAGGKFIHSTTLG